MKTNSGKTETTTTGAAASSNSSFSQLLSEFGATLSSVDTNATRGIQTLQQVHQARLSLLTRTAATLKARYGAEDLRSKAAQTAVTATTATVGRIAMVSQQLATAVPQVSAKEWAFYGRVFDEQSKPLAKYTVFLVDSQKTYQEAYGFAYTDETGYFLLSDSETQAGTHARAASHDALALFVEVANTKGQPIYLSTTVLQAKPGTATYQQIVVPSGNQPIGDPPEAIRNVAMPGQKEQSKARRKKTS
jgi:hypothetical protein